MKKEQITTKKVYYCDPLPCKACTTWTWLNKSTKCAKYFPLVALEAHNGETTWTRCETKAGWMEELYMPPASWCSSQHALLWGGVSETHYWSQILLNMLTRSKWLQLKGVKASAPTACREIRLLKLPVMNIMSELLPNMSASGSESCRSSICSFFARCICILKSKLTTKNINETPISIFRGFDSISSNMNEANLCQNITEWCCIKW